jgi:hypothetical protein
MRILMTRYPFRLARACIYVSLSLFMGAGEAAAQNSAYDFVKVEYPGALYTDTTGINNAGHVVGTYLDTQSRVHGYVFDGVNYTTVDFPGSINNFVFGIGPAGEILGTHADILTGYWTAWIKDANGFRAVPAPYPSADVRHINTAGKIVGSWDTGGPTPEPARGFLFDGAQYLPVEPPGARMSVANGINEAEVISGAFFDLANRLHGFAYVSGTFTRIDFPGASETGVGAINNQNGIAGWMRQGSQWRGFVATNNSFRTLTPPVPGATQVIASAVNDSNQVAGSYRGPGCNSWCGYIATPKANPTPPCTQTFTTSYDGSTLTLKLKFALKTAEPMTWSTFVVAQNTPYQLWSVAVPAITSTVNVEYPIPNFPAIGPVLGVSMFTRPDGVHMCADLTSTNTGP